MSRHPRLVLALAAVATLLAYAVAVVGTGFAACGLFGCSGGKASYSPTAAQVGLLLCGLALVPLALLVLRRTSRAARAATAAGAAVAGAVVAMVLLGLGPHGCPASQSRTTAGPGAFDPGAATCSGDGDALR